MKRYRDKINAIFEHNMYNKSKYGATRYMCMANINYGDQTLGEREVTCRANKHDTKKYIPNNYEKIYIMSGACGSNEATSRVNRRVRRTPV